MNRSDQHQQVQTPQLGGAKAIASSACLEVWPTLIQVVVRDEGRQHIQKILRASRRQLRFHTAQRLPQNSACVRLKLKPKQFRSLLTACQQLTKTFVTPSISSVFLPESLWAAGKPVPTGNQLSRVTCWFAGDVTGDGSFSGSLKCQPGRGRSVEAGGQVSNEEGPGTLPKKNRRGGSKPPQCDLKATPKPVDSQRIATPKPPQCDPNATPMRPQCDPKATSKPPQG